ncbi:hypothetical protein [Hoeflea sp. TYP-13]|uniref:DUF6950 family protein n=1 Tax=Hoeflea sp. TYP-13 TaxID=3230023 RepID=UPI0034C660AC
MMTADMETAIRLTLERMDKTVFTRGTNDCDAVMADYWLMRTGLDPMAKWRGTYNTDEAAEALILAAGGNGNLVEEGMRSIGFEPKDGQPARGDFIVMDFHGDEVAGLFLDPRAAFKTARGSFRKFRPTILKAWSCD